MEKKTEELMEQLTEDNIHSYLRENQETFIDMPLSEYLRNILIRTKMRKSEVIHRSGIDRTYAYQILNGERDKPSRDKLLRLAFGLRLDVQQTQQLLRVGQQATLYPRFRRDSVVLFALKKRMTVMECDNLLEEMREPILD